jgi:alpha-mannosidase
MKRSAGGGGGPLDSEGAMYVEPDTNMPSGEALIRQLCSANASSRKNWA